MQHLFKTIGAASIIAVAMALAMGAAATNTAKAAEATQGCSGPLAHPDVQNFAATALTDDTTSERFS